MRALGLSGAAYVISDDQVLPLYGARVEGSLREAGFSVAAVAVPAGETSKSLAEASRLYDWLVAQGAERGSAIVALGGGVVGDLAGFVAASYLRGVPFVQVPTSLLAMVDASVGGKVAVDLPQGKNLVGAFYQPRLVAIDVSTLRSLSPRHLTEGWAELVKHGLILDADLFAFLEAKADALLRLEPDVTVQAIARSVAIKARVVSEDEKETGLRTILNYGPPIAHALETATEYSALLHGEAVAIGMRCAARIGQRLELTPAEVVARQDGLLDRMHLPAKPPRFNVEAALEAMQRDKKVRAGAIRWVLLEALGRAVVRDDVPFSLARDVLLELSP
ncbi:MAG: 3-dehydroquinate synthase [Chloroflexi bacterium]|nr:3-dehydroquinate synthase [Chloroflexota bacterium]